MLKSLSSICALIMLTASFIGCIPVNAEELTDQELSEKITPLYTDDWDTGVIYLEYTDCYTTGDYDGLYVENMKTKVDGNWKYMLERAYVHGIRYKVSGVYYNVDSWNSCTVDDWTAGGIHYHKNIIVYNTPRGRFTLQTTFYTGDSNYIGFHNALKWENLGYGYTVTEMSAWWKMEWKINAETNNKAYIKVSGVWSEPATETTNTATSWQGIYFQEDDQEGHYALATTWTGSNLQWGVFEWNYDNFHDHDANDGDETIYRPIGSVGGRFYNPTSGALYSIITEWRLNWA